MSYTTTINTTFTKTHAEHIASKIAADLRQLQGFYGSPSEQKINDYIQELVILLSDGYLKSIDYGFQKDGEWVLVLSYEIYESSGTLKDDNTGRVPIGINTTGASWYSYLRKSSKFENLSFSEQEKIESSINIKRSGASDPSIGLFSSHDKTYSSSGVGADRKVFSKS